ncbi:hypothetical protein O3G_MSEX015272 [Manduca sexta]|uniref:PHD-type domain-containing protein n=1 Tax=Manduca sexta TaxID=7130 RepID=A0A922CZM7_MANSE|nr:hypothetical protein O3G_MSEX015272 [Manduca sexta]
MAPSSKCDICDCTVLVSQKRIKCTNVKCNRIYHSDCVNLIDDSPGSRGRWICPVCIAGRPKGDNFNTPIINKTSKPALASQRLGNNPETEGCSSGDTIKSSQGELSSDLTRFREEIRAVREEFKAFRLELLSVREILGSVGQRIEGLEARMDVLEKNNCQERPSYGELESKIEQLTVELNDRNQEALLNDIEFSGLTETDGENLMHTVMLAAKKIGIELGSNDVVSVTRVGSSRNRSAGESSPRSRPVVVRLARRIVRDELIKAARVRRGATTEGLNLPPPHKRFYVNERLTKTNRMLYINAREAAKQARWRFVWTRFGKIFARREVGSGILRIRSTADIGLIVPAVNAPTSGNVF